MTGTEPKLTEPIKLESGTDTPSHVTPPPTPIKMYDVTISMAKLGKQCSKSGQKAAEICSCCSKRSSKRATPIISKTRILEEGSTPPQTRQSGVRMRQHPNTMGCCCCDGSDDVAEAQSSDRRCSTLRLFVLCLALLQLVQVMGSGYGKSSLTSIERRYQLNSFQIGFLQSCFHIGNLTLILFVSYYGSGWHRPRAIAIGALMMSAASFLSAAPQFINKRYQPFHTTIDSFSNATVPELESASAVWSDPLCRDRSTKIVGFNQTLESIPVEGLDKDEQNLEPESWLFILIAVGSVIKGMGHTPLHPLGISFIDDFASPDNSAMYIGIVSAFPLFGPAVGFIIGSFTTNLWVDFGWVKDVSRIELKPTDVRWVGAWWIGYLASGILLLLVSIPLFFFPKTVPTEVTSESGGDDDGGCLICMQGLCTSSGSSSGDEDDNDGEYLDDDERSNFRKSHLCTGSDQERILRSLMSNDEKTLEKIYSNRSDVYFQNYRESNLELYDVKSLHNLEREKKRNCRVTTKSCSDYPSITAAVDSDNEIEQHLYSVKCLSTPVIARAPTEQSPSVQKAPSASRKCQSQIVRRTSTRRSVRSRRSKRLSSTYDPPSSLKDFCKSLRSVLGDAVFVNTTLGFVCLTSFLGACFTYISKYMETQFNLSASSANLLNGSVNLPMAVVGNVFGGWVVRRGNLNVKRTLCIIMIGLVMTLAVSCTLFFFVGDDDGMGTKDFAPHITDQFGQLCSNRCGCEKKLPASPVCDVTTQMTYRSACFAGCHDSRKIDGKYFFYNCTCLLRNGSSETGNLSFAPLVTNFNDSRPVVAGECTSQNVRSILPYFIAFMGAASMSSGLSATPSTLAILRVVKPSQKALAIGVVFVFTRVLAWIPSPIYVGYAIDRSCQRWSQKEGSSSLMQGAHHCESYDKGGLRRAFFGCTVLQLLVALIFYFTALVVLIRRSRRRNDSKDSLLNLRVSTS